MSSHGGHSHVHLAVNRARERRLLFSLVLTLTFLVLEAVAGIIADSLALLTDAVHNLTDVAALALTWFALKLADRPSHAGKTFGYHRVGILAALFNSSTLVLIALGIAYEAWERYQAPRVVDAEILMGMGGVALLVNLFTAWLVSDGARHDLNLRSAFLHLMGDVFSTLGAIVAGVTIYYTGLDWLDPLASLLIALLILWNGWLIIREAIDILLESTPSDIEMSLLVRDLMTLDSIRGVHDLHVWSLSSHLRFMSAHVEVDDRTVSETATLRDEIACRMKEHFAIDHVTLQFESTRECPDRLYCQLSPDHNPHAEKGERGDLVSRGLPLRAPP